MAQQGQTKEKMKLLNQKLNAMMEKKGLSLATSLQGKSKPVESNQSQTSKNNKDQPNAKSSSQQQSRKQDNLKKTKKIQKSEPIAKLQKQKQNRNLRKVAGMVWEDKTMETWPQNDYRIFVGNLGKQTNDTVLASVFRNRYPSFNMARVVIDRRTGLTRGYGFVSFAEPRDFLNALKQMDGKYIGNRPAKIVKSNWKDRNLDSARNQMLPSDFKVNSKKQTHKVFIDYKYAPPM